MRETERSSASGVPELVVRLTAGRILRYSRPFHIGRDSECEVRLQDAQVSRRHAEVFIARGQWSIRDLQSSNGLFVDGHAVQSSAIGEGVSVTLGADGPSLRIEPLQPGRRLRTTRQSEQTPDEDSK